MIAAHALLGFLRLEAIALARQRHGVLLPLAQVYLLQALTATLPLLLALACDRVELIVLRVFVFFFIPICIILLLQIVLLIFFGFFILLAFVVKLVGDIDRTTLQLYLLSILLREEVRSATRGLHELLEVLWLVRSTHILVVHAHLLLLLLLLHVLLGRTLLPLLTLLVHVLLLLFLLLMLLG